ncbi:MAG: HDIG domain-containing protein [Polyangiaceae bacterium]|nr:HDIG domain-containing protein [Polyangiaceae bacterium]
MLRTRVKAGLAFGLVMAAAFAALLTFVQLADRLVPAWAPVVGRPAVVTLRSPYGPLLGRDPTTGLPRLRYESRRALVPRGAVVLPGDPVHQVALAHTLAAPLGAGRIAGAFAIHFALAFGLLSYLRRFGQNRLRLVRTQAGLLVAMALLAIAAKLILLWTALPEYWIPISAVPLWIATSFDRRTGFLVTVVLALVVASLLSFDVVLFSVMLVRGTSATLFYLDRKHRLQMVIAGALAGASAGALLVAILAGFEGRFDVWADLQAGLGSSLLACVGGGVTGGVASALLRSPAERLLGQVPRERLLDLTDLEQPLLQRLSRDAPGSWEHSRAMANLAEAAAAAIGADALLTRVGAYYHDMGKAIQPKYFVENLGPDEPSPHEGLDPDVSADAIMAHVVVGTRTLREAGVPESVTEFAYTHHGTQLVEYFWNKCQQTGNPKNLKEVSFRYPGMKPQTKETAILMLVDSIEAASRTVDPPGRAAFENMVQRVIFTKLLSGQLDESGLDMQDLRVIAARMTDTLVNMNHHRIKYPWQVERAQQFGVPTRAVRDSSPQVDVRPSTEGSVVMALRAVGDGERDERPRRLPAAGPERTS